MFERVCSDARRWSDDGMTLLPVSVNISRIELLQEGLMDFIKATVEKYGVDYSLIEIEITETAAVADYDRMGILRLDALTSLHVDTLKIDRSLSPTSAVRNKGRKITQVLMSSQRTSSSRPLCEGIEIGSVQHA